MNRIPLLLSILCGVALVSGSSLNSTADDTSGSEKQLKLALVSNNAADYWRLVGAGCRAAAKELGHVRVQFRLNQSGDSEGQIKLLKEVLATKPDGVAVSVNSVFKEIDYLNDMATRTLLVCFDSDVSVSKRVGYVGTDNLAAGVQAGELIKECLPEGGKIILFVGNRQAQNAIRRHVGITRALKESNIEILDILTDDSDPLRAQKNVEEALAKHPDVGCLVGLWDYEGPAILEALRNADKTGQVKVVCFDDQPETLVGVGSGIIYGTVVQNPFEIGKQTVIAMERYLHGDKTAFGEDHRINIPTRQIKQDDVSAYLKERGRILVQ